MLCVVVCFFLQAEDGIRDLVRSRGLGDVYKRQERVGPADHRGPDLVAGGVLEREPLQAGLFEALDVLFDVGVFALELVDLGGGVAGQVAQDAVSYTHLTLPTSDLV